MSKIIKKKYVDTLIENVSSKIDKNVNESFQDYIPMIAGTIGTVLGIKLFGKKVLIGVFGGLYLLFENYLCKKFLKSLTHLLVNNPEKIKIEYKKIKNYYQIVINSNVITRDFVDVGPGELDSDIFPATLKFYENGDVEIFCMNKPVKKNFGDNIYDELVEFIQKHGKENLEIRSHDEEQIIFDVLYDNLPNIKDTDEYEALVTIDTKSFNKVVKEISSKLEIPENVLIDIMEKTEPHENPKRDSNPIWDYVKRVYSEILKNSNNTVKLEHLSYDKPLMNEELSRFKKLSNYTYKK